MNTKPTKLVMDLTLEEFTEQVEREVEWLVHAYKKLGAPEADYAFLQAHLQSVRGEKLDRTH